MSARLTEKVWASVVVLCCLAVGVTGGAVSEGARATVIETGSAIESRAEGTEKQRHSQQAQRANASAGTVNDHIRVDVAANGSAAWTIQYRVRLNDANDTAAFEALRAGIEANRTAYRERFTGRLIDAAASAEVTTGREMAIENASVTASRSGDIGIVTYTFDWRNFAATNDDGLRIGDALVGFFLDEGTRLTIAWPDGYEPTSIGPSPDGRHPGEASWDAPTGFDENEPIVELVRTDTDSAGGSSAGEGSDGSGSSGDGILTVGLVIGGALLLAGTAAIAARRRRRGARVRSDADASGSGVDAGSVANDVETTTASIAAGTADERDASGAVDRPDGALLSNEERVVEILRQLGGRAKQQQIVQELGWTDAKTSQVVGRLREDGSVEGFRLGRENVLILSEETDDESNV